jgi:hypothetical protein
VGECVEVDGKPARLGVAERNFLHTLATRADATLSKYDDVEGESGRPVPAVECRRRLGRRLGTALAELLVPSERGEPYRLRTPEEVRIVSARAGHPVELRVTGRGSVRTVHIDRLENLA